ncbi:Lariat debranching enzyme [Acorus calamus]|uniref:Lariat debranching enzyme n=1 Tax=Acorus calamus TaxID=4465 RepID=A0AAV9DEW0_ACOCL|nr:Lariat debranching enzyme [Acorus calamus]
MKIAIEGCMHGDLDNVYATLQHLERVENTKIDLLICCGDFQAVRNENDLNSLNVKPKYRNMMSFWKYYSGQVIAPFPTLFVGGNHEASNYLWELYYGGWAAPNIFFMGLAGVIKFGGIRIGGLSGIYNARHYSLGHYERVPYNESDIRSVYHVREYDVYKLMQIEDLIDIFISHDWPLAITEYGNKEELVRQKPYFRDEISKGKLGSLAAAKLLDKLKPTYWFSAHLHCKFPAVVQHGEDGPITKFLALDKCLPGRKFLQVIEIGTHPGPYEIKYDEEWLAITRKFNYLFPLTRQPFQLGDQEPGMQTHREWVRNKLEIRGAKPFEFVQTVPSYNPSQPIITGPVGDFRNPQTEQFLNFLELPYLLDGTLTQMESPGQLNFPDDQASDDGEDAAMDDVDEIEELAGPEPNNANG